MSESSKSVGVVPCGYLSYSARDHGDAFQNEDSGISDIARGDIRDLSSGAIRASLGIGGIPACIQRLYLLQEPTQENTISQDTHTSYGLRVKATGKLVTVGGEDHVDLALSDWEHLPTYALESLDALTMALFEDTPGYNATMTSPGWGRFERDDLEPVCVTVTTDIETVALPPIRRIKATVEVRDIHYRIAKRYVGEDFEKLSDWPGLVFWLVKLPDGETLESVRDSWQGNPVQGNDRWSRRHVYRVLHVPEDYVDLFDGEPGALFIASGSRY